MPNSFEDYQDLSGMGYQGGGREPIPPEQEFFHSVYISGKTRKNHINIEEIAGKIQIRGVEYNLDKVHMIITHTKDILVKEKNERGRESVECFSYKNSTPWSGTSKLPNGSPRICPVTSGERASNSFCGACRAQIVVAGIYCDERGNPILTEEKKPIFIFIRGKGTKYTKVSDYLNERFKEDLPPIFEPATDASKHFEKSVVNNKRFVTRLIKSTTSTQYNNEVDIFTLEKGVELPKEVVMKILKISKDQVDKFNEKFDWSRHRSNSTATYSGPKPNEGILQIPDEETPSDQSIETPKETESKKTFSFDDIEF